MLEFPDSSFRDDWETSLLKEQARIVSAFELLEEEHAESSNSGESGVCNTTGSLQLTDSAVLSSKQPESKSSQFLQPEDKEKLVNHASGKPPQGRTRTTPPHEGILRLSASQDALKLRKLPFTHFRVDDYTRPNNTGWGRTCVLQGGKVFEKAGIAFSSIFIDIPESSALKLLEGLKQPTKRSPFKGEADTLSSHTRSAGEIFIQRNLRSNLIEREPYYPKETALGRDFSGKKLLYGHGIASGGKVSSLSKEEAHGNQLTSDLQGVDSCGDTDSGGEALLSVKFRDLDSENEEEAGARGGGGRGEKESITSPSMEKLSSSNSLAMESMPRQRFEVEHPHHLRPTMKHPAASHEDESGVKSKEFLPSSVSKSQSEELASSASAEISTVATSPESSARSDIPNPPNIDTLPKAQPNELPELASASNYSPKHTALPKISAHTNFPNPPKTHIAQQFESQCTQRFSFLRKLLWWRRAGGKQPSTIQPSSSTNSSPQTPESSTSQEPPKYKLYASGLSLVIHPSNPHAPSIHSNVRFFQLFISRPSKISGKPDSLQLVCWWFGGGTDLSPSYLYVEDVEHFHKTLKNCCNQHPLVSSYPLFKEWCDEYFFLPHRQEHRGVGGIFFDNLFRFNKQREIKKFVLNVMQSFLGGYLPILKRRICLPFTEKQKLWQQLRRGRYVEFNLLYDRGTKFGLNTPNARIESILMSLPLMGRWEYMAETKEGSEEEKLVEAVRGSREWA